MSLSRRSFLLATGAGAVGALPWAPGYAADTIKLGSVLDNSGNLDIYGKPMVLATKMAVDEINEAGGLLLNNFKWEPGKSRYGRVLRKTGLSAEENWIWIWEG